MENNTTVNEVDLTTVPPVVKPARKPKAYLNNKSLLEQVIKSKEQGRMNDELAKMLHLLCYRLSQKGNFVNYSYNEDMRGYALLTLVHKWAQFDEKKYTNCFAYYTQIIKNAFIQYLKHEKKQRITRDKMLVDMGMNPSYTYSQDGEINKEIDSDSF